MGKRGEKEGFEGFEGEKGEKEGFEGKEGMFGKAPEMPPGLFTRKTARVSSKLRLCEHCGVEERDMAACKHCAKVSLS